MSREEHDREDLLREATALVERIELVAASPATDAKPIVIGFRRNGALSIFFGADPVYQFNAAGELRRAYRDGLLYKAERGRLVSLEQRRTLHEVQLVRRDLTEAECQDFVLQMQRHLGELRTKLADGSLLVAGQVPVGGTAFDRVRAWLVGHDGLPIAASPRA
jgi:hypothetical protein